MSIKVWIAPVLAALALGVISCTQPNQTAHSAGAQYTGYITPSNGDVPEYPEYAKTRSGTRIYRIIDCDTKSIVYSSGNGLSAITMRDSRVVSQFCGGN